jgi:diacylglycerol kinase (ATP)
VVSKSSIIAAPPDCSMKSSTSQEIMAKSPETRGTHVPVQIDGEVWGRLPMSFRIEPAGVEVIR